MLFWDGFQVINDKIWMLCIFRFIVVFYDKSINIIFIWLNVMNFSLWVVKFKEV
jgi:hypothetical protein